MSSSPVRRPAPRLITKGEHPLRVDAADDSTASAALAHSSERNQNFISVVARGNPTTFLSSRNGLQIAPLVGGPFAITSHEDVEIETQSDWGYSLGVAEWKGATGEILGRDPTPLMGDTDRVGL